MTTPNYYRPGDPLDKIVPFLCPACGGINDARQHALLRLASGVCFFAPYKKCDCLPEPESAPEHDGWLDEQHTCRVSHDSEVYWDGERIHGVRIDGKWAIGPEDTVTLTPAHALSLLAWLLQERTELERLAKEQSGE